MGPGHRHDFMNFYRGDVNTQRLHNIGRLLLRKMREGLFNLSRARNYLAELDEEVKELFEDKMAGWKETEKDFVDKVKDIQQHKGLHNIYDADIILSTCVCCLVVASVLTIAVEEEQLIKSQAAYEDVPPEGPPEGGMEWLISEGISLESLKASILCETARGKKSDVPATTLVDMRADFNKRIERWNEQHLVHLVPLVDAATKPLKTGEMEEARRQEAQEPEDEYDSDEEGDVFADNNDLGDNDLGDNDLDDDDVARAAAPMPGSSSSAAAEKPSVKRKRESRSETRRSEGWRELNRIAISLPSTYHKSILTRKEMGIPKEIEIRLRKQLALKHLSELRTRLITSYALRIMKKQSSGQSGKTRSNAAIRRKYKSIWAAMRAYRRCRNSLLILGLSEGDKMFKPLLKKDVKPFTAHTDDEMLGEGKTLPSWLWENLSFVRDYARKGKGSGALDKYMEDGE
ncbi:hypothetical protein EUX98_g9514 [Antrodiella citrinella]|uniref:Uncharacterized protein n=1 Tax=Antrodiella citrinella TaxID=2447956 RepID=A0A4S4LXP8_9APHY|nr:hypothetical protein EUX98_g9514 [Antrodiella citrinella]